MSVSKMRIKMGEIEVEYEGSEDFIKQELPEILGAVSKLYQNSGLVRSAASIPIAAQPTGTASPIQSLSVTTIAAKLPCKSGPDLILAAATRLSRDGVTSLSRQSILDEIKLATGFYKATYRSNLSNYLLTLVKEGKLQETAKDTYALSASTKTEIEAKLAA
jgi:hypothetical protein